MGIKALIISILQGGGKIILRESIAVWDPFSGISRKVLLYHPPFLFFALCYGESSWVPLGSGPSAQGRPALSVLLRQSKHFQYGRIISRIIGSYDT